MIIFTYKKDGRRTRNNVYIYLVINFNIFIIIIDSNNVDDKII